MARSLPGREVVGAQAAVNPDRGVRHRRQQLRRMTCRQRWPITGLPMPGSRVAPPVRTSAVSRPGRERQGERHDGEGQDRRAEAHRAIIVAREAARETGPVLPPPGTPGTDLPVRSALPALADALSARGSAVLVAPPGTGKTTLVPLALAGALPGRIVVAEPRRVAARAAARRMAALLGEAVGGRVGYSVRGDSRRSAATRIEVVTTGLLVRRLQADPELAGSGRRRPRRVPRTAPGHRPRARLLPRRPGRAAPGPAAARHVGHGPGAAAGRAARRRRRPGPGRRGHRRAARRRRRLGPAVDAGRPAARPPGRPAAAHPRRRDRPPGAGRADRRRAGLPARRRRDRHGRRAAGRARRRRAAAARPARRPRPRTPRSRPGRAAGSSWPPRSRRAA